MYTVMYTVITVCIYIYTQTIYIYTDTSVCGYSGCSSNAPSRTELVCWSSWDCRQSQGAWSLAHCIGVDLLSTHVYNIL